MTDKLRAAAQAALEFAEFCWREVPLNDWAESQREAVEQALRAALAEPEADWSLFKATQESLREHMAEIHRLRAALAEPDAEPVAWRFQSPVGGWAYGSQPPAGSKYPVYPLYAAPPSREWLGLTDEERFDAFDDYLAQTSDGRHWFRHWWSYDGEEREAFDAGVAAAEAALKEKNNHDTR